MRDYDAKPRPHAHSSARALPFQSRMVTLTCENFIKRVETSSLIYFYSSHS